MEPMPNIPESYKSLYSIDPEHRPFADIPELPLCWITHLPACKRNQELIASDNAPANRPFFGNLFSNGKPITVDNPVDFKQMLLPIMLQFGFKTAPSRYGNPLTVSSFDLDEFVPVSLTSHAEGQTSSFPHNSGWQLGGTSSFVLPTDSQWTQMNQMRIYAGAPERSLRGIERLSQYYSFLGTLEAKFPFEQGEIKAGFVWYDAYSPNKKMVTNCLAYEKAAVLYNIGSIYAYLATYSAGKDWIAAGDAFEKAAGAFQFAHDSCANRYKCKVDKFADVSPYTLNLLATIMLAQATECYYHRANHDKKSSSTTSIVATQTADAYDLAYSRLQEAEASIMSRFPKLWIHHLKAKMHLFFGVAHFHYPLQLPPTMSLAERLARLQFAAAQFQKSRSAAFEFGGALEKVVFAHWAIAINAITLVKSANFEVHHQPSVDPTLLAPLKRSSTRLVTPIGAGLDKHPEAFLIRPSICAAEDFFHALASPSVQGVVVEFLREVQHTMDASKMEMTKIIVECEMNVDLIRSTKPYLDPLASQEVIELIPQAEKALTAAKEFSPRISSLQDLRQALMGKNADIASALSQLNIRLVPRKLQQEAAKVSSESHERLEGYNSCNKVFDACAADITLLTEDSLVNQLPTLKPGFVLPTFVPEELKKQEKELLHQIHQLTKQSRLLLDTLSTVEKEMSEIKYETGADVKEAIAKKRIALRGVHDGVEGIMRAKNQLFEAIEARLSKIKLWNILMQDRSLHQKCINKVPEAMNHCEQVHQFFEKEVNLSTQCLQDIVTFSEQVLGAIRDLELEQERPAVVHLMQEATTMTVPHLQSSKLTRSTSMLKNSNVLKRIPVMPMTKDSGNPSFSSVYDTALNSPSSSKPQLVTSSKIKGTAVQELKSNLYKLLGVASVADISHSSLPSASTDEKKFVTGPASTRKLLIQKSQANEVEMQPMAKLQRNLIKEQKLNQWLQEQSAMSLANVPSRKPQKFGSDGRTSSDSDTRQSLAPRDDDDVEYHPLHRRLTRQRSKSERLAKLAFAAHTSALLNEIDASAVAPSNNFTTTSIHKVTFENPMDRSQLSGYISSFVSEGGKSAGKHESSRVTRKSTPNVVPANHLSTKLDWVGRDDSGFQQSYPRIGDFPLLNAKAKVYRELPVTDPLSSPRPMLGDTCYREQEDTLVLQQGQQSAGSLHAPSKTSSRRVSVASN